MVNNQIDPAFVTDIKEYIEYIPFHPYWINQTDLGIRINLNKAAVSYWVKKWINEKQITMKRVGRKHYLQRINKFDNKCADK